MVEIRQFPDESDSNGDGENYSSGSKSEDDHSSSFQQDEEKIKNEQKNNFSKLIRLRKRRKVTHGEESIKNEQNYAISDRVCELFLAHLSRFDYPSILVTCKGLGRVIFSEGLYGERFRIKKFETITYALIRKPPNRFAQWYILSNVTSRLHLLASLPHIPIGSAVVTIGHEIFVFGGTMEGSRRSDVFVFDCRFHTVSALGSMRLARNKPVAGVIKNRIYVFGGCVWQRQSEGDCLEIFDLRTRSWTHISSYHSFTDVLITNGKIYAFRTRTCYTFDPENDIWGTFFGTQYDELKRLGNESTCNADGLGFFGIDHSRSKWFPLVWYDAIRSSWTPLYGVIVGDGPVNLPQIRYADAKLASFGNQLLIMGSNERNETWCVEIDLEMRNDIWWGKVTSVKRVLKSSSDSAFIEHCCITKV